MIDVVRMIFDGDMLCVECSEIVEWYLVVILDLLVVLMVLLEWMLFYGLFNYN